MPATGRVQHPLAEVARRLRPFLRGKRVLLVGEAANKAALKTAVRLAGGCVMAAGDIHAALLLFARYPIDLVVVDPRLCTPTGETFEELARGRNVEAVFVDFPHRPLEQILVALPQLKSAQSRGTPARRPARHESWPPRRIIRRAG